MDRDNALRLGYTPALRDSDIDSPMLVESEDCPASVVVLIKFWVDSARIQGRICTTLYGPGAAVLSGTDKARIAASYAAELQELRRRKAAENKVAASPTNYGRNSSSVQLWTHGDDIMHFSIL